MIPYRRPDLDQFLLNLQSDSDYKEADLKTAQKFRKKHRVQKTDGSQFSLFCSLDQFDKYEPAVKLYFMLVRAAAVLMLVLFLIQLPPMISNYRGGGLSNFPAVDLSMISRLFRLSMANQQVSKLQILIQSHKEYSHALSVRRLIVGWDMLSVLTILCFLVWWQYKSQTTHCSDVSPKRFTIFVKHPSCSQPTLTTHFNQFSTVRQVSLVKDISKMKVAVDQLNILFDRFKKYMKVYGRDHDKTERVYDQLCDHYLLLKKVNQEMNAQNPMEAFVSFQTIRGRNYVMSIYNYGIGGEETRTFQGEMPKIQECGTDPNNLMWENIAVKNWSRWKQSGIMSALFVFVIFIGLITMFLIKINSGLDFQVDNKNSYTYAEVIERGQSRVTDNFCYRLNYRSITQQYYHLCHGFVQRYGFHVLTSVQYSCVVVVINFLLNRIISSLTVLNKYSTKSQADRTLMMNLFVIFFLNTALVPVLMQWETGKFSVKGLITDLFRSGGEDVHLNTYKDFSKKWYLDVGNQVTMTYFISFVLCTLWNPVNEKIFQLLRNYSASRKQLQKDMNMALLDPQFDFNYYYAQLLATIFFCLFYSSSMPFMYLLCSLSLLSLYISTKYIFIRFTRQPKVLDHSLNDTTIRIIPFGLLLHVWMTKLFCSSTEIMPHLEGEVGSTVVTWMLVGLILLFMLFKRQLARLISYAMRVFGVADTRVEEIALEPDNRNFDTLWRDRPDLSSYKIEDNPKYHNILYIALVVSNLQKKNEIGSDQEIKELGKVHQNGPQELRQDSGQDSAGSGRPLAIMQRNF